MNAMAIPGNAVQLLLDGVDAYIQTFQPPLAPAFLRPVFEATLSQIKPLNITRVQAEQVVQAAMAQFNPLVALQKTLSPDGVAIATQVDQQLRNFKPGSEVAQILEVLDAYIQKTKSPLSRSFLYPIVTAIIPYLDQLKLPSGGTVSLANQAMLLFQPDRVATRILGAKAGSIAAQVIQQIQSFQPEQVVLGIMSVVEANLLADASKRETALYYLAKTFLAQMIDIPSPGKELEHFAMHVNLKFGGVDLPSQSPEHFAKTFATQLAQEVDHLRAMRAQTMVPTDATKPTVVGDLQVGINVVKRDSSTH